MATHSVAQNLLHNQLVMNNCFVASLRQ